jgi:hypothetical protein
MRRAATNAHLVICNNLNDTIPNVVRDLVAGQGNYGDHAVHIPPQVCSVFLGQYSNL